MKNVAIVTIYDEKNFGNKLQNYAVEQLYLKNGYNIITIRYKSCQTNSTLKNILIDMKDILVRDRRYVLFKNFSKTFLHISKNRIKLSKKNIYGEYLNTFDYVSVGSDQVWNDYYLSNYALDYFLLSNISSEKRIACAPSIASDNVKNKYIFANELKKFKLLSCRELNGVKILENLSKKNVKHLMDPTLAISKCDWDKLLLNSKANIPQEKYIFVYILGETDNNSLNRIYEKYVETTIINILDKKTKFYNSGPIEFIDYIKNADIVVTNSFHGMVFSIIYNKDFYVVNRKNANMNNRILTLFDYFNLPLNNGTMKAVNVKDKCFVKNRLDLIEKEWASYIKSICN